MTKQGSAGPCPHLAGGITLLLMAVLPLAVAAAALLAPPAQGAVAAVFPPWWDAAAAVTAAGAAGPVVRLGALPFVVVVAAADRSVLRAAGAWLLLDPVALGGCAPAGIALSSR
jgi:hypothetical protein